MSRGVKDLRELICVSRLTIRDSDEEDVPYSDEEGRISRFEYAAFINDVSGSDSRQSSAQSNKSRGHQASSDSGVCTNGVSPDGIQPATKNGKPDIGESPPADSGHAPRPPLEKKKQKRRRKNKNSKVIPTLPPTHELPKTKPLPPVGSSAVSPVPSKGSTETDTSEDCADTSESIPRSSSKGSVCTVNFDHMFVYLDATSVSEWLSLANTLVADTADWCHQGDNYVQFAHFWLTEMPQKQRQEILKLEYGILIDQFNLVFAAGREAGHIRHRDIVHFTQAVYREYPATLFSSKGAHTFLTYLDTLTCERAQEYKKLLSDVRCSTKIKQHAQWTLACRAFCLVSVWGAVVRFFRTLHSDLSGNNSLPQPDFVHSNEDSLNHHRMYQAIRNEYCDVIHYLVTSGKVKRDSADSHQRTLVFSAVIQNKVEVLLFLLKKIKCKSDIVNRPADNGNTPLHAAANVGDVKMVGTLLNVEGIHVDAVNPQCEHATPLHLAVMHGHEHVVEILLVAKADATLTMGGLTPLDIARDFGHDSIAKLLQHFQAS